MRFLRLHSQEQPNYTKLEENGQGGTIKPVAAPKKRWWWQQDYQAWRFVVRFGVLASALVMLANTIIFLIGFNKPHDDGGPRLFYVGNCATANRVNTIWHILINILSTLLLGASNCISQILAAPTRAEVDNAHARGKFLHIGIFDFANLRLVGWKRATLCALIALSSIPLHLLYNSVIFTTTTIYDYHGLLVYPEFSGGAALGYQVSEQGPQFEADVHTLQAQIRDNQLELLSTHECLTKFSVDMISDASAVVVVTKENQSDPHSSVLKVLDYVAPRDSSKNRYAWICDYELPCSMQNFTQEGNWNLTLKDQGGGDIPRSHFMQYPIDRCLVQKAQEKCTVDLSMNLMAIVIICNFIKLISFTACLLIKDYEPLITVGDAVCSFLQKPDKTTPRLGPVSCRTVRTGAVRLHEKATNITERYLTNAMLLGPGRMWHHRKRNYFAASASMLRKLALLSLGIISALGSTYLGVKRSGASNKQLFTDFGFDIGRVISDHGSLLGTVMLANVYQLAISVSYPLYNTILTNTMISTELSHFAGMAKPMRVSSPKGSQRSTYWLQLPYRWSIPLMSAMALLHWLVSQALFVVNVKVLHPRGYRMDDHSFCGLAWSPAGALYTVIVCGLLILFLFFNGFRKFETNMPLISSNSIAISAACHPTEQEPPNMELHALQYGVTNAEPSTGLKRVGFSAREVTRLRKGKTYFGLLSLKSHELKRALEYFTTDVMTREGEVNPKPHELGRMPVARRGVKMCLTHKDWQKLSAHTKAAYLASHLIPPLDESAHDGSGGPERSSAGGGDVTSALLGQGAPEQPWSDVQSEQDREISPSQLEALS